MRVDWINENKSTITALIPSNISFKGPKGGTNAAQIKGWSGGGWGYWLRALKAADITCPSAPYWSGSNSTPSTAIPNGVALFIQANCPGKLI